MSRAINIDAPQDHVTETCAKRGCRITAIEPLASGGTRVVLSNSVEAAQITKAYGKQIIGGTVERQPIRPRRQ